MVQFDEHIFQMGWFNHQLEIPGTWGYLEKGNDIKWLKTYQWFGFKMLGF